MTVQLGYVNSALSAAENIYIQANILYSFSWWLLYCWNTRINSGFCAL